MCALVFAAFALSLRDGAECEGICAGCVLAITAELKGGSLGQDEIRQAFANMEARMQEMHSALLGEQAKTADLEKKLKEGRGAGSEARGLFGAIRNGHVRYVVPEECINIQASGAFQPWARAVEEFVYWHDFVTTSMIEDFESMWAVDTRRTETWQRSTQGTV